MLNSPLELESLEVLESDSESELLELDELDTLISVIAGGTFCRPYNII